MEHAQDQRQDDERHDPRTDDRRAIDRRLTDRRHLQAVASVPRSAEARRGDDRRKRDRRVRIAGAGLLAGLAFATGAREFANLGGFFEPAAPMGADRGPALEPTAPDAPGAITGEEAGPRTWDKASLEPFIQEAAALHGLPADLIRAVIQTESRFNPLAVSRVGAKGLMQLMPKTAKHVGIDDPFDPRENILGGTKYLSLMLDRFNGNTARALAAYNAGPTVVSRYRGIPPYRETRGYVQKIHRLVEDTAAEFALPPPPKVRQSSLRSRARARQASVRRASSRSSRRKAAVSRRAKTSRTKVSSRRAPTPKRTVSRRATSSRAEVKRTAVRSTRRR